MCTWCDSCETTYKERYCSRSCYIKSKVSDAERAKRDFPQIEREYEFAKQRYDKAVRSIAKLDKWKKKYSVVLNSW